jgi:hypothetical protein
LNLARPGRLSRERGRGQGHVPALVGSIAHPDHAAFDRFVPHPVYAKQRWISILNPSRQTVHDSLMPLIAAGHARLAARRSRQGASVSAG